MIHEIWKDVTNYEECYQVSNLGNVKTKFRIVLSKQRGTGINTRTIQERILGVEITKFGYLRVTICRKGINKRYLLHRLVAMIFIPNPENKPCVNHLNGIKSDNRVENLEWVTYSENEQHSFKVLGKKIIHTDISKKYMSKAKRGKPLTEEHKAKLRKPKSKKHIV